MEAVNINHSTKDIPVPKHKLYLNMFISSIETFYNKAEWRMFKYLYPEKFQAKKNTFGFPSIKNPPRLKELESFRADLINLTKNIEFRRRPSAFQDQLRNEVEAIREDPNVIVSADKTSNHYRVDVMEYKELVEKEVHSDYKKAPKNHLNKINKAHKTIVNKLEIEDRVFQNVQSECFVTIKDHKSDFPNHIKCRLLNPYKVELGKVSHQILKNAVNVIRKQSHLNQWGNTYECIEWFKKIPQNERHSFIVFDIVSFYPSISDSLLNKTLDWAQQYITISEEERENIFEARKSLLYYGGNLWVKKSDPNFDVPMGAYDGAELCDIVGLFLLSELQNLKLNATIGGYKDDNLAVSRASPRQTEMMKKKICEVFRRHGLEITIEANKQVVQFLDVEFDLKNGSYKPYLKRGDVPLYVNAQSNHPPHILKNIPLSINKRLSALSSSQAMFDSVSQNYQEALIKAGHNHQLHYDPPDSPPVKKRQRKREVIWWNPPFSLDVKTKVGEKFFKILSKNFPKGSPYYKLFNQNTVKMSYRTTPNLKRIISSHNKKILNPPVQSRTCNCKKTACPLDGNCLLDNMVYQASVSDVSNLGTEETYIGMTGDTFKHRVKNHEKSFKHRKYEKETSLSKYIWNQKDKNTEVDLHWRIIDRAPTFSPVTRICPLCVLEKYYIIFHPDLASLNDHEEIFKPCLHRRFLLLDNT